MSRELLTIGQIADKLQELPACIVYFVSKYRLKPVERVGIIRLFSEERVKAIKTWLYGIQIRKTL